MAQIFDPILSEVMRHELISASEEMNITMKPASRLRQRRWCRLTVRELEDPPPETGQLTGPAG